MIKKVLGWIPVAPMETILVIIALGLVTYAGYYMLPMSLNTPGVVSTVFSTLEEHILVGLGLMFPGLYALHSVRHFYKTRDATRMHMGSFLIMVTFAFLALLRIFTFGIGYVGGWILLLIYALVSMVCYLYFGWKAKK